MKPVLFSTPMVQAILEGHKSMTRRVIKPQPQNVPAEAYKARMPMPWMGYDAHYLATLDNGQITKYWQAKSPCISGDILWVRETWCEYDSDHVIDKLKYAYKADATLDSEQVRKEYGYKWRPSIFMPREAARIFLRVTDIKVERIQDITGDDAEKEGAGLVGYQVGTGESVKDTSLFKVLWDSINSKRGYGWDKNPWVWIISFERINITEVNNE